MYRNVQVDGNAKRILVVRKADQVINH
jgi:hypothetical protein